MSSSLIENKIYKGDIGTEILLDAGSDISAATTLEIHYKKPDNTEGVWTATIVDSDTGTNMGAKYVTIAGDINQAGVWLIQLYVDIPLAWTGRGETYKMKVYENFK